MENKNNNNNNKSTDLEDIFSEKVEINQNNFNCNFNNKPTKQLHI
jgi:hypothetical protein